MNFPKRSSCLGSIGLLAMLVLGLMAWNTSAWADGGTLRIVPQADLKILDPNYTTATITTIYGYHVYDTLFGIDGELKPVPQMVDTYEISSDGLTYTMTLRPGLKFHDGGDVTARDVAASIKRWFISTLGKRLKDKTTSVAAINDKTVVMKLNKAYGLVLDSFARMLGDPLFIMPERIANTDSSKQITSKIGSGPYKFVEDEWVPGSKVVFEKFDGYIPRSEKAAWTSGGKVVRVNKVEWVIIPDPSTTLAALVNGEVDVVEDPAVDLVQTLKGNPDVTVAPLDTLGRFGVMVLNHLHPPFNNAKAREAMMWMTNQEEHLRAIAGSPQNYTICPAFFICGSPLESKVGTEALAGFDLDKARQLMKESGYKGEKVVMMVSTTHSFLNAAGLVSAQNLRKIGVNVDVQQMDWGTLTSRRPNKENPATSKKGWHIFHTASKAVNALSPPLMSTVSGGGAAKGWYGWPSNPLIDKYRDELSEAVTLAAKKSAVDKLQGEMFKTVSYINYGYWVNPAAYRSSLKGLILSPVPVYWNVAKQ